MLTDKYAPDNELYQKAIDEGIGPNLWNIIASFGFIVFGLAVVFAPCRLVSQIARQILINAYSIGCLTFGLLLGKWFVLPFEQLVLWQHALFSGISIILLGLVFLLNGFVWYLSFLLLPPIHSTSNFLVNLSRVHWSLRAVIGSVVSTIALLTLIYG